MGPHITSTRKISKSNVDLGNMQLSSNFSIKNVLSRFGDLGDPKS